ncbi:MAG: hypothetical protein QF370_00435 [Candidatus Marinimicrobia bacterium]|nr:hypothetical protein [Candidatus Neomarinimicrobiota bacterium]|tara:strand:- start:22 stop:417 length:396 start_codon:yes stop_codon:yes gene_type:complete
MTKSKYDLSGNPIKSYGNVAEGCPITMDMGCFKLYYREPICGGNRMFLSAHTATVKDAVAEFNQLCERGAYPFTYAGGLFDTPLRIERYDTFGNHTHTYTMDARFDTPRLKRDSVPFRRSNRRRYTKRYSR